VLKHALADAADVTVFYLLYFCRTEADILLQYYPLNFTIIIITIIIIIIIIIINFIFFILFLIITIIIMITIFVTFCKR